MTSTEHQHIEWKESWRDDYLKWICAFANAEGGTLVIGRNDRGQAVGVPNARKLLEDRAGTFFRTGYIESWGRGIEKIHQECMKHGVQPPDYDDSLSGLMLTFVANPQQLAAALGSEAGRFLGSTPEKTTQETTQETTRDRVLALLTAQPSLTRQQLAQQTGLTADGIKYHLEKLKAAGKIRHIGPTKRGYWEILK